MLGPDGPSFLAQLMVLRFVRTEEMRSVLWTPKSLGCPSPSWGALHAKITHSNAHTFCLGILL